MLTRPSLEEIRRLAEVATKGPWEADLDTFDEARGIEACVSSREAAAPLHYLMFSAEIEKLAHRGSYDAARESQELADARYIASVSPPVVLALLDELEALRELEEAAAVLMDALDRSDNHARTVASMNWLRGTLTKLDSLRGATKEDR